MLHTMPLLFLLLLTGSISNSRSHLTAVRASRRTTLGLERLNAFVPLSCNAAPTSCTSWTASLGTSGVFTELIIVPCGQCYIMDHTGDALILEKGIDIQGKLVLPDGYKQNILTPMVVVQGELEMTATKPVDGIPLITFTMTGQNDQQFQPIRENALVCHGEVSEESTQCKTGKKAFVVAGGKVTWNGIPEDTPTWLRLQDTKGSSERPDTIVIEESIRGKWAPGATILITSHTNVWNEQQERKILDIRNAAESGHVEILLESPIVKPTTAKEYPDFAVEVALLSRNILFKSGKDENLSHGGHLWIRHTPDVAQTIQGVEFRDFGQQGTLGRYPIHFHLCDNQILSTVAKNTIRNSHQRCIVVHGTNNLMVRENIAFDTKGHCFMTEDGIETGNTFLKNLGAQTGSAATVIPDGGANGIETDHEPATFWLA